MNAIATINKSLPAVASNATQEEQQRQYLTFMLGAQVQRLTTKPHVLLAIVSTLFILCVVFGVLMVRNITRSAQLMTDGMNKLADGDLTIDVPDAPGRDELASMQRNLRETVARLSQIITEVRGAADNLSSASEEVSATAQSMSQATSEQAASVEETSASVEQMSASINQNTERVRCAHHGAYDAPYGTVRYM